MLRLARILVLIIACGVFCPAIAQEYCPPDRDAPGDAMIQAYLARETETIEAKFLDDTPTRQAWEQARSKYRQEYLYMLGLDPMPPKTPLQATITGTLEGGGFSVEMVHYQSRPRLYVTGNLYRPAQIKPGHRLPAVFYVCGHSHQGRSGNKTAYQSHGIWFARHGYICLVVDSLQLGEIAAIHHGTYREGRWWWHSRGYTPAGVECLNGIRGIDYLVSRPDVDPQRIAVTGISGGGAATHWISAADERVRVAVPVSGMADLRSYVTNRVINGHCDCMFFYNTFQWPCARIGALIAPRAQLFANSDQDKIFPMDANDRTINRLKRVYSLFGASDMVDCLVSMGDHAYRKDLRQGIYRFINMHLKDDPRILGDSEADLVVEQGGVKRYPIDPDRLRAFCTDADIPKDELNTTIDRHFVAAAQVPPPSEGKFDAWKKSLLDELRRVTFRYFPERIPPAKPVGKAGEPSFRLESEPRIVVGVKRLGEVRSQPGKRILLVVRGTVGDSVGSSWLRRVSQSDDEVFVCEPRGVGGTRWTEKNPPNYVARSHVLLGRTVDTGRIWDIVAVARYLHAEYGGKIPVCVVGEGSAGVLAVYAALWEPEIAEVIVNSIPHSHEANDAPPLLNIRRVCDIPEVLGMLAPRSLTAYGKGSPALDRAETIYRAAGSAGKFRRISK
jgi:dienelactone hydrolase